MVQGGYGVSRRGIAVTKPMILDVPSATSAMVAYVSANYCQGNAGQASLPIQTAN